MKDHSDAVFRAFEIHDGKMGHAKAIHDAIQEGIRSGDIDGPLPSLTAVRNTLLGLRDDTSQPHLDYWVESDPPGRVFYWVPGQAPTETFDGEQLIPRSKTTNQPTTSRKRVLMRNSGATAAVVLAFVCIAFTLFLGLLPDETSGGYGTTANCGSPWLPKHVSGEQVRQACLDERGARGDISVAFLIGAFVFGGAACVAWAPARVDAPAVD